MRRIAVIALIRKGNKYLIVNHIKRGWDITGGYVFPKEDIISALCREVLEETGFKIDNIKLKAIYSNLQPEIVKDVPSTKTIFGFLVDYINGDFEQNSEITSYQFIRKEKASEYITDKLQLVRFNDLVKDDSKIIYVAYNKDPYSEVMRQKIN